MSEELDLKPCPFCGGTPKICRLGHNKGYIYCRHCGVTTRATYNHEYISLEKSRELWNMRIYEEKFQEENL